MAAQKTALWACKDFINIYIPVKRCLSRATLFQEIWDTFQHSLKRVIALNWKHWNYKKMRVMFDGNVRILQCQSLHQESVELWHLLYGSSHYTGSLGRDWKQINNRQNTENKCFNSSNTILCHEVLTLYHIQYFE